MTLVIDAKRPCVQLLKHQTNNVSLREDVPGLYQETGTCEGLAVAETKEGAWMRDMNVRTAATRHISLSVLLTKLFALTLKGSVLDTFIWAEMTCGFSTQSTEISLNVW